MLLGPSVHSFIYLFAKNETFAAFVLLFDDAKKIRMQIFKNRIVVMLASIFHFVTFCTHCFILTPFLLHAELI